MKEDEDEDSLDENGHAVGGYAEDDDFDYEDYIEREFPKNTNGRGAANWKQWIWRVVVVVVCLLLIWRFLLY